MKNLIFTIPLFIVAACFSQSQHLQLINLEKGNTSNIHKGDKVIIAVKQATHQVKKKPSSVYLLSKPELEDSVFVFTKGRILSINNSTIVIKERNSFFSANRDTRREINIDKINTLRKLTTSNQIFRTVTTVGGGLALGIMIFYSYAAVGGGDGFVSGMFKAAGAGAVLTRFGRTKISKRRLNNSRIEVVSTP